VRAYAVNADTTVYGADVTFTTLELPTVTTGAATAITDTTATGNGDLTDLGVPDATERGVCWGTTTNPDTSGSHLAAAGTVATGTFTVAITGLTANTLYHVRAYAVNADTTVYGADVTFTTLPPRMRPILPRLRQREMALSPISALLIPQSMACAGACLQIRPLPTVTQPLERRLPPELSQHK